MQNEISKCNTNMCNTINDYPVDPTMGRVDWGRGCKLFHIYSWMFEYQALKPHSCQVELFKPKKKIHGGWEEYGYLNLEVVCKLLQLE